jgi:hypothetical protein
VLGKSRENRRQAISMLVNRPLGENCLMPKGSKVAQVETKLKREYPGNPRAVYGTLNKAGLMQGNKPTAKGLQKAPTKRR